MKKSKLKEIPKNAKIYLKKRTDGLAMNDIHFEYYVLFVWRNRKYYFVQNFDFQTGFRKTIYMLSNYEWKKTYNHLNSIEWNYAKREWI